LDFEGKIMMKSFLPKDPGADRDWFVVDAAGIPVGRLGVKIANVLRGKDKPTFSPQVDTGAFVVVVNAAKVKLTGSKEEDKQYDRFTGFRGGHREVPAAVMRARHPERMIQSAVKGMLPKNRLCRHMFSRLKVYPGVEHPHAAQQPRALEV
jgi:large subunit ribosomal protein L13